MLIVDSGYNRVEGHAKDKNDPLAQVRSEQHTLLTNVDGVNVVTETPGPHQLVELMYKRIWGVPKEI
jgi:hypothetical protein